MIRTISCTILLCLTLSGFAQTGKYYWVHFQDKPGSSAEQILVDQSSYVQKLTSKNIEVFGVSKWFNAAFVFIENPKKLQLVQKLTFIKRIELSGKYKTERTSVTSGPLNYGQADVQINMLGLQNYHAKGFTGKGITLALFDAGFYKVDSLSAFDSLRKRNGILATRDFASNNKLVYDDHEHGMYVLSVIAGYIKDSLNGAAPDVNLLLARTEVAATEKHMEEFNWIKALEWADSIGVDIIHSSLGYSRFDSLEGNYTYNDMDGKSTIITRAAQEAFKRGIFITNSAGNEGKKDWKFITAPCDGKDVLCVGSVDSFQKKSKFSSFGPSADGRVKPDVMAMGENVSIVSMNGIMRRGSGTSFSGPLIAGFVACLKQSFPSVSNSIILDAIRKSGHLYTSPSDTMGYGIPNIQRADSLIRKTLSSMQKPHNPKILVYPNPSNNIFRIQSDYNISSMMLFDATGKAFFIEAKDNKVDLSNYMSGVYAIKINLDGGLFQTVKLIKI